MKRALVAILSLALIICLAIPALAAEDVVIYDFSDAKDAEDTLGYNEGLTNPPYGFSKPVVTVEDGHVKMQFTGDAQTNAAVGGYFYADERAWVSELVEQAPNYKYMRLYVENQTPSPFYMALIFAEATEWGSVDMSQAVLINTKGEKVETVVEATMNKYDNAYLQIPAGFAGNIYMLTDVSTFGLGENPIGWGKQALTSWAKVTQMEWDLRNVGDVTEGNDYMIWDDLALVNEIPATTDPGTDDKPATDDPNQGGDVSMLLYAAAAVSGLGALAIRRKK